ncbi:MAG: PAS domain-containing protein [Gemmatimonadaceae bacterium]|nr:PAS domain-containing protein [Gemmatimonadaceae bacterium]
MAMPRTTPFLADLSSSPEATVARLEHIFDALPLAVAEFDIDLLLMRANLRYRALIGALVPAGWRPTAYDAFPNALADLSDEIDAATIRQESRTRRVAFRNTASALQMVELTFVPLSSGGLLIVGTEVTEIEGLRQALARSVAQLEAIFDVLPESVRVFDSQGIVMRENSAAHSDHASQDLASLRELWRADLPRRVDGTSLFVHEHPTARALRGETVRSETMLVRRGAQGEQIIEVNSNPLRDAASSVVGAVTVERDVTERTRLARELAEQVRRANELYAVVSTEAERLEQQVKERTAEIERLEETRNRERRLAAVGQLAAGVMHDVNNALNPIVAAAHLLQLHASNPEKVRDYAIRIARAAETGAATASRVGRFLRQDPIHLAPDAMVDLAVVTDEVIAMTRPIWAERVGGGAVLLNRTLSAGVMARAVAGEVREALLNLIQNALDAMKGGGTLGVTVRRDRSSAIVEVHDTGHGMSSEVRERAFEPFFSTKGPNGSGLGLAEVYGVMKRHNGRIEIESEVGRGSTVRLVFPVADPSTRTPPVQAAIDPHQLAPRRILVVEDHVDGRELVTQVLQMAGHEVIAVATVAAAEAELAGDAPPFDVVVTDIGLPDGIGTELATRIRQRFPNIRVGVITGWELRPEAMADAHFSLRKPLIAEELLAQVAAR